MTIAKSILSIQSNVAYGYVGNRAAVFPLQRLGYDVSVINTVQFSNHTGYQQWTGDIFSVEHIQDILRGLEQRNVLHNLSAVLSGYLGDPSLGEIILNTVMKAKKDNSELIYCCDPVIGDVGRGIFVKPSVAEFFKQIGIKQADILTPNQFELNYLTDMDTNNLIDLMIACEIIRTQGPKIVLVTSVLSNEIANEAIGMLIDTDDSTWLIQSPRLSFAIPPNGAGDATAALFLGKYLESYDVTSALEHTMSAIFAVFKRTFEASTRELQLITSQDELVHPQEWFQAKRIR